MTKMIMMTPEQIEEFKKRAGEKGAMVYIAVITETHISSAAASMNIDNATDERIIKPMLYAIAQDVDFHNKLKDKIPASLQFDHIGIDVASKDIPEDFELLTKKIKQCKKCFYVFKGSECPACGEKKAFETQNVKE